MGRTTDLIIQKISPIAEFAFLMGSAETAHFNVNSDVDVAVYWKAQVSETTILMIREGLEEHLERDVDLISLNIIDEIFAGQVLSRGRLLINANPGLLLQWKVEKMSRYPDFKYSRRVIEDQILTRRKYV